MFEPTNEQIEALAKTWIDDWNSRADEHDAWIDDFRDLLNSAAGQAIIRAAQAEAWDEGYDRGFYDREALSPDITGRDASEGRSINPFEESADV